MTLAMLILNVNEEHVNAPGHCTYDENMLVQALLQPIEIALQCCQFQKKFLNMKVYEKDRANFFYQTEITRRRRYGRLDAVANRTMIFRLRGWTNCLENVYNFFKSFGKVAKCVDLIVARMTRRQLMSNPMFCGSFSTWPGIKSYAEKGNALE